jgi:arylsulfatase A-like enzyme
MNFKYLFLQTFFLLYVSTMICNAIQSAVKEKNTGKPNVIIILTDDQGYGDVSAHGNPIIKTPNLDQLYQESIHFTQFHAAPMSTPTRGELLTGKDAFRNGAVFVNQGKSHMHRDIPTIADVFSSNGYATGHFGKWHLGDNYPYRPQDRGFQETIHHGAWGVTSLVDYWSNDYFNDTYSKNGEYVKYDGYCTDVWFNEAMKWMKKKKNNSEPFLTFIATNVPHIPRIIEESYMDLYKERVEDIEVQAFYGMITQFDENLGKLEKFLLENDLRDNTIFIFMTDNGTTVGDRIYNAGMRGKKTSYYDGGHRVPFFLRWPAKGIDENRDINELTHSTDLFPTLMVLCNLKYTEKLKFDGVDLSGLIFEKEKKLKDRMKVISYRELKKERSAVLWNKWRLVNYSDLYNIEEDPGQKKIDIASEHPEIVKAMQEHYDRWEQDVAQIDKQEDLISIGTEHEPETFLCSANWYGNSADSWNKINKNPNSMGYYNLQVDSTGKYEVALYRWPKESGLTLTDDFHNINIAFNASYNSPNKENPAKLTALPVSEARLTVDEQQYIKSAEPNSTHITFEVNLKKDEVIKLEPMFLNAEGEELCGVYFTYVKIIQN